MYSYVKTETKRWKNTFSVISNVDNKIYFLSFPHINTYYAGAELSRFDLVNIMAACIARSSAAISPCLTQGRIPSTYVISVWRNDRNYKYMFISSRELRWFGSFTYFFMDDKDQFILHIQYHGCWWPGSLCRQGISSHGIDPVLSKHSAFSKRKVKLPLICDFPRTRPREEIKLIFRYWGRKRMKDTSSDLIPIKSAATLDVGVQRCQTKDVFVVLSFVELFIHFFLVNMYLFFHPI